MQTKEAIRFTLDIADRVVLGALDRMSDSPTVYPTPNGGCHPLWVLGHLTIVESIIPSVLFGEQPEFVDWLPLFGENSIPVANPAAYPSFDDVRAKYVEVRDRNFKLLETFTETDLDRATKMPPKGREREFATYGSSFLTLAVHKLIHRGNVTDAIRAAGRA